MEGEGFYRVEISEDLHVDVTELDVALVDESLKKSVLRAPARAMIRSRFLRAVVEGRFKLMGGDIDEHKA